MLCCQPGSLGQTLAGYLNTSVGWTEVQSLKVEYHLKAFQTACEGLIGLYLEVERSHQVHHHGTSAISRVRSDTFLASSLSYLKHVNLVPQQRNMPVQAGLAGCHAFHLGAVLDFSPDSTAKLSFVSVTLAVLQE